MCSCNEMFFTKGGVKKPLNIAPNNFHLSGARHDCGYVRFRSAQADLAEKEANQIAIEAGDYHLLKDDDGRPLDKNRKPTNSPDQAVKVAEKTLLWTQAFNRQMTERMKNFRSNQQQPTQEEKSNEAVNNLSEKTVC